MKDVKIKEVLSNLTSAQINAVTRLQKALNECKTEGVTVFYDLGQSTLMALNQIEADKHKIVADVPGYSYNDDEILDPWQAGIEVGEVSRVDFDEFFVEGV